MVKQRKKAILISVMLAIILLILIVLIRLYLISSAKITCSQIAQDICSDQVTWREHITYEMLSEDIQAVVSQEEFEEHIANNDFLEYAKFVGNYYGTPKQYVDKLLEEGKNVFLEIEVNGAMQAMKLYKGLPMVSIFLIPPSFEELEYRIRHRRSEPEEVIHERLSKAHREINLKDNYDYCVLNDSVERAADEIKTIIKNRLKKLEETGK